MQTFRIDVKPTGKPRMTRSDKWKQRPCVMEYFRLKDTIRLEMKLKKIVPTGSIKLEFHMKPPESWSQKKKDSCIGLPHKQKPDIDNCAKFVLDSVYDQDNIVYNLLAMKIWDTEDFIEVSFL